MKVLLTGANGFIGSHLLDELVAGGFDVRIVIRNTSNTRFISDVLPRVEVCYADLRSPRTLPAAVEGVDVVVHAAAKTKALRTEEYYEANAEGVHNLVAACNEAPTVRQIVVLSSLAVSGPGTVERPAREDARPRPVSHYGRSKALGERHVRREARAPYTILRPAAVYGPRDTDFFVVFQTLRRGLMPLVNGGRQRLNLIHVSDVVQGALSVIGRPEAYGATYHLAHAEVWTQEGFQSCLARAMGVRPARVFLPHVLIYAPFAAQEAVARLTRRPSIVNLNKVPEYGAPGWVCSTDAAARELGFQPAVGLVEGARRTYEWYVRAGWFERN